MTKSIITERKKKGKKKKKEEEQEEIKPVKKEYFQVNNL